MKYAGMPFGMWALFAGSYPVWQALEAEAGRYLQ